MPEKIALAGPESTGKTTLSVQLADYFQGAVVKEIAREYIDSLDRPYSEDDLLNIARLQCAEEDKTAALNSFIFCDTTLLVIKIWSWFKYGRCHPWIEEEFIRRKYNLYLLCDIDLPWEMDKQRENPLQRAELFALYRNELEILNLPYVIVNGIDAGRTWNAIELVKKERAVYLST
jgi:nicotinamide riboside kinase